MECSNELLALSLSFGWGLLIEGLGRQSEGKKREVGEFTLAAEFLVGRCVPLPKAHPQPVASPTFKPGSLPVPLLARGGHCSPGCFFCSLLVSPNNAYIFLNRFFLKLTQTLLLSVLSISCADSVNYFQTGIALKCLHLRFLPTMGT